MCQPGDTVPVRVKIPADLSCTGEARYRDVPIDRCIAPVVAALQQGGIDMRASCCGHGQRDGEILLQDGRTLVIRRGGAAGDEPAVAHLRALKRQGKRLAAERDWLCWALIDFDEQATDLVRMMNMQKQKIDTLENELAECRRMRSTLVLRARDYYRRIKELEKR